MLELRLDFVDEGDGLSALQVTLYHSLVVVGDRQSSKR
jgi:hypothetical protein